MGNWAQMDGGTPQTVCNVIVADAAFAALFPAGTLIEVDAVVPQPGIGWTFDGTTWTPPLPEADAPSFDPLDVDNGGSP